MAAPRVRKRFNTEIPKFAPDSEQAQQRKQQGLLGEYDECTDELGIHGRVKEIYGPEEEPSPTRAERLKQAALDKTPKKLKNPSDIQVRIRTGAVYISLTVVCLLVSQVTAALYLAVLSAICAGEFFYILRADAKLPNEVIGVGGAACFPLSYWLFGNIGVVSVLILLIIVLTSWYVFWRKARITDVANSLFGAIYTGFTMTMAMYLCMALPDIWGGVLVLGIFASIWGNDAFAYLIGSAIGKHKMVPAISPKKSWEGFIAGLIFSMAFWCVFIFIPGLSISIPQAIVFGGITGVFGVLGDLVESRIKRNSGVKDSGTIMPGHGGLLDRCDSQFLAIMVATALLIFGGCLGTVY